MRLPSGYGSIVKLGGKRRRPFAVRITTGWTDTGKQLYKYIEYFETRKEALACLDEYNKKPYDIDTRKTTFNDIHRQWVEWRFLKRDLTFPKYYQAAYNWCKSLHDRTFIDLRADDIQDVIDACKKGYSTKKNIKTYCSQLFKYAARIDLQTTNYAAMAELPTAVQSKLHHPFTPEEIKSLWANLDQMGNRLALINIYTGLRPTELLKTKTENVFLSKNYLKAGMKTAAGKNRVIPIADKIKPLIEEFYNPENEYLIIGPDGKPLRTYERMRTFCWQRSKTEAMKKHLPHDGRHTCATMLSNRGVEKKIIQLILGHRSQDITDRVYTHKTVQQLIDAINLL